MDANGKDLWVGSLVGESIEHFSEKAALGAGRTITRYYISGKLKLVAMNLKWSQSASYDFLELQFWAPKGWYLSLTRLPGKSDWGREEK